MGARTTTGGAIPRVVHFETRDGERGFARRFGRELWGADRWRGWRLCGIQNKRAGAALVGGPGESIRVKVVQAVPR